MINNGWKCVVVCFALLWSVSAWSAKTISSVDEMEGWKSCVKCAGGQSNNASLATSGFHENPSRDGASRDFWMSGSAYSNALWWRTLGANNNAKNFTLDFWMKAASNTSAAQAFEFDAFQYIGGRRFMFGTQCSYGSGVWDVWNAGSQKWIHSKIPCKRFTPNVWYHVKMNFYRDSSHYMHYDKLSIVQYKSDGKTVAANNTYSFNMVMNSGWNPAGWSDTVGVNFQMDIGKKAAEMQEWVDQVHLTAW